MGLSRSMIRLLACVALPLGFATLGAAPAHAQQSVIAGRVTGQGTGEPIPEARVILVGTSLFTTTNADGRYTIRNVPAGTSKVYVPVPVVSPRMAYSRLATAVERSNSPSPPQSTQA